MYFAVFYDFTVFFVENVKHVKCTNHFISKQNGSSMLHGDYLDANLIDEKEYNKLMFLKQYVFGLY